MKAVALLAVLGFVAAPSSVRLSPSTGAVDLGARWTTTLTYRGPSPALTAVHGARSRPFTLARIRKGVYRASIAPDAVGTWTIKGQRRRRVEHADRRDRPVRRDVVGEVRHQQTPVG